MRELDFDIVVVANYHRKPLIIDHLKNIQHIVSYSRDVNLPPGWKVKQEYSNLVRHMRGHIGHHRCLEGHKSALRMCKKDIILVLEDDAVPNRSDWLDVVIETLPLVEKYEIVSLHGREVSYEVFDKKSLSLQCGEVFYHVPKDGTTHRRVLGSLAYFIKSKDRDKIYKHNYNGFVIDFFLANNFNFCLIDPSPFNHDRSQGSLID